MFGAGQKRYLFLGEYKIYFIEYVGNITSAQHTTNIARLTKYENSLNNIQKNV